MISHLVANQLVSEPEGMPSFSLAKDKYELKHVEESVQLMRNRVEILKKQLQKEKQSIQRHKSLTDQTVQQKIELNKITSIKQRDKDDIGQKMSSLKVRNSNYRQSHKNDMSNILKALYMVKMDDAQQIKNASLENRKSFEKMNDYYYQKQREKKRQLLEQSEKAKERFIGYWKKKLNGVYSYNQKKLQQNSIVAEQKRRELEELQNYEMSLLEEINEMREKNAEAKKEYVAAISLKNKEVQEAVRDKQQGGSLVLQRNIRPDLKHSQSNEQDISCSLLKSPSFMSSSDVMIPRASVDQKKLGVILRQLRRQHRHDIAEQYGGY